MPDELSIPRMPRKQIELWDITSTSGNFRPYQIQTANIYFNQFCVCTGYNLAKDKRLISQASN